MNGIIISFETTTWANLKPRVTLLSTAMSESIALRRFEAQGKALSCRVLRLM